MHAVPRHEGKALATLDRAGVVQQPTHGPHLAGITLVTVAQIPHRLETGLRVVGLQDGKGQTGHIVLEDVFGHDHPFGMLQGGVEESLAGRQIGRFLDGDREIPGFDIAENLGRQHRSCRRSVGAVQGHAGLDARDLRRARLIREKTLQRTLPESICLGLGVGQQAQPNSESGNCPPRSHHCSP